MATIKKPLGARTAITTTAHNSLAAGTFVVLGTITHNTNQAIDDLVEVTVVAGASISGGKQVLVYAKQSLDGTNFTNGPESGTGVLEEPNLFLIGAIPLGTTSAAHTGIFSLASVYDGNLPYASKIILKNDSGAALGNSGNSAYHAEVTSTVA